MTSYFLTNAQVQVRNAALVQNLRYKFPQLGNYSDAELVIAYNTWFMQNSDGLEGEDQFVHYLPGGEFFE